MALLCAMCTRHLSCQGKDNEHCLKLDSYMKRAANLFLPTNPGARDG